MPSLIDRRTLLRGLSAAIALPWLEAMSPGCTPAEPAATADATPLVLFFAAHGVIADAWFPSRNVGGDALPRSLEPLQPFRQSVTVVEGLSNLAARRTAPTFGPHSIGASTLLTARPATQLSAGGPSVDRVVAARVGAATRIRGLSVVNDGPMPLATAEGANSVLFHDLSWEGVGRPVDPLTDPQELFDRLFRPGASRDPRRVAQRRSVLDAVRSQSEQLRRELGREDRARIDEYLDAVRELERTISASAASCVGAESTADAVARTAAAPREDRARVLLQLVVLALRCDLTRVVCFALSNALNEHSLPWLGVTKGLHAATHENDPATREALRRVDRHNMEQFASLLHAMRSVEGPGGTLLDRSCVIFTSETADAYAHDYENLPVLVAGRARGRLPAGRNLQLSGGRGLGDLWATVPRILGHDDLRFEPDGASPIAALLTR
ncbi:MAG: DUF1552 domain-containing protein [Polyangiales bacterium]